MIVSHTDGFARASLLADYSCCNVQAVAVFLSLHAVSAAKLSDENIKVGAWETICKGHMLPAAAEVQIRLAGAGYAEQCVLTIVPFGHKSSAHIVCPHATRSGGRAVERKRTRALRQALS